MTGLPVLSCDGCGACCTEVVWPPFYGDGDPSYMALGRDRPDLFAALAADRERRLREGCADAGTPCSWLDLGTMRCRNYDHRPEICRDFEMGGEGCLEHRRRMAP